ncbi:MAG: TPM domain-containing protein [Lachnospiraceae bacterium]
MYDEAGLFTEEETRQLEDSVTQLREEIHMDVAVVTADQLDGKTSMEYADDFYDEHGFGVGKDGDGVLLLMDMYHRELTISTTGVMVRILTDERIDEILDAAIGGMADEDYKQAADVFLQMVGQYYQEGIQSDQYIYDSETGRISVYRSIRWHEALVAVIVAAAAAAATCVSVQREYLMKRTRSQAANFNKAYTADCRFLYQTQDDRLINQFVTQHVIARNNSSGGGSRSGGSGSGRSTVHRSSSGRSHGGGSRKF